AIADQINGGGLGLINPALYKIGADPARYAADFFDVASNNTNQADPSVAGYPSTQGWDAVTGLGTPNAAALVPDLVQAAHGHQQQGGGEPPARLPSPAARTAL